MAVAAGLIGFATTVISIALALIPAEDDPNKLLAVTKSAGLTLLLVAAGALVYWWGRRRTPEPTLPTPPDFRLTT